MEEEEQIRQSLRGLEGAVPEAQHHLAGEAAGEECQSFHQEEGEVVEGQGSWHHQAEGEGEG